jgi:hypothetical protein
MKRGTDVLSAAVVAFIWGDRRLPFPSSHPDAVHRQFGDQAEALLRRIDELVTEIFRIPPVADLAACWQRIEDALQLNHPELNDEARKALAAKYTYNWK